MTNDADAKSFDVMKWLRETRDRYYEETKDMSFEERRQWSEERIRRDPFLAKLYDRRKVATGGRTPTATGSGQAWPEGGSGPRKAGHGE